MSKRKLPARDKRLPYVIRLSERERRQLTRAAKKAKLLPAVYARQAILSLCRGEHGSLCDVGETLSGEYPSH